MFSGRIVNGFATAREFFARLGFAFENQQWMAERVIPYHVSGFGDLAHNFSALLHIAADQKKCGARIVARAWLDAEYKRRLLTDADAAIAELGLGGQQGQSLRVVENTPKVHNVVVCTLCSCYPWSVLGLPPVWYKSTAYRSRTVIDPRGVLGEFGLKLAEDVQVRVWDSTAELRYLVLPERPPGTEQLSESELAALVTRDSMIGTRNVSSPGSSSQTRRKS